MSCVGLHDLLHLPVSIHVRLHFEDVVRVEGLAVGGLEAPDERIDQRDQHLRVPPILYLLLFAVHDVLFHLFFILPLEGFLPHHELVEAHTQGMDVRALAAGLT